jgi:hypothetical protein
VWAHWPGEGGEASEADISFVFYDDYEIGMTSFGRFTKQPFSHMEERKTLGTYFYKNCFWGLYFSGRIRFYCQCAFWETVGIRSFLSFIFLYHFYFLLHLLLYPRAFSRYLFIWMGCLNCFYFRFGPFFLSSFLFYFMFLSSL